MRTERRNLPRWLAPVAGVFAVWVIVAALLALQLVPDVPGTVRGWLLLLVVGPPAYLALEWASGRMFNAETGARVSTARFSLARIAVALVVMLVALAPFAWWFLRGAAPSP
jgi:hypothetical protein